GFERRSRSGNTFEIKHLFIPATAQIILTPPTSNREEFAEQTFLEIDWRKFTFRQSINKKKDCNFPNFSSNSGNFGFERRSRSGNTFEIKHLFIPATAHSILTPPTSNREEFAEQTFLEIDWRKFTFRQSINKKREIGNFPIFFFVY
ncbi:MAG: hypothetical protein IKC78_01690, partial [Alistipes sp.]|nr:hypothetical protein [Alistipes sp.]